MSLWQIILIRLFIAVVGALVATEIVLWWDR